MLSDRDLVVHQLLGEDTGPDGAWQVQAPTLQKHLHPAHECPANNGITNPEHAFA